jgi:O-antigen/teichoic acid export membrane protein
VSSAHPEAPPAEADDVAARGVERWRRIWKAAFGAAAFRAVSIVGTFVTVPLVLSELGDVRFGALVLVTQLATLLVFSDLGLGNGLVTSLARALANEDRDRVRALVSSTWFLLVSVALAGGAGYVLLTAWLDWSAVLGVDDLPDDEVTRAVTVFAAFFLVGLPVSIAQKIHLARQEGWQANAWQTLGALATIAATIACVMTSASLAWFVAAAVGGAVLSALLNCVWLFARHAELRPHIRHVRRGSVRFIFRTGLLFLVLGVASSVAYQTDALVISHVLGAEEVTSYNIALRLFLIPGMAVSFLLAPLWPAFGDAFVRGDRAWARVTLRRAVVWGALINIPGALLLVTFGQQLVDAWVGPDEVAMPQSLLMAFGIWTVLSVLTGPLAMLLNGANVVGFQVVCAIAMAFTNVLLSIVLTQWVGVSGPVIGSVIATTCCITVPSIVYVRRMLAA